MSTRVPPFPYTFVPYFVPRARSARFAVARFARYRAHGPFGPMDPAGPWGAARFARRARFARYRARGSFGPRLTLSGLGRTLICVGRTLRIRKSDKSVPARRHRPKMIIFDIEAQSRKAFTFSRGPYYWDLLYRGYIKIISRGPYYWDLLYRGYIYIYIYIY